MNPIKPLDKAGLYEVHSFTDTLVGDMRMLVPVCLGVAHGIGYVVDPGRPVRFFSSVTLSLGPQMIPTGFEIEGATTLEEAIDMMPAAAQAAGEAFRARMEQQQRQHRLLVPGATRQ